MASSNVKIIYINSASGFRDISGTDANFEITKPISPFDTAPKRVKLLTANIPFTWDNITTANNRLTLIELPGPVSHPATVPVGRYTGTTLATALQTALNTVATLHTYTVAFDTNTFKFTISATGNFQLNFAVTDTIAAAVGFDQVTTSSATSVTSTNVVLLQADPTLFIRSNLVEGVDNGIVPWFTGSTPDLGILASVPISVCYGGTINYAAPDSSPWLTTSQSALGKVKSSIDTSSIVISFQLFFLSGLPIDMKGAHWCATLLLDF